MMEVFDVEQGSEEWFVLRRGLLTGSRLGKIITPKTGKLSAQANTVMAELIAEPMEPDSGGFSTYWTERGILMEEEAALWYEFQNNVVTDRVGFVKNLGAGFSPDRFVGDDGMLEIKCPKGSTHVKYLLSGELPDEYKAQVHGGLIICERKWCDFVSYHPEFRPLVVRVEPDDYTETMRLVIEDFIERLEEARREVLNE